MHRIHRSAGRLLAIVAAAALAACASDDATAPRGDENRVQPPPAIAGDWVLQAVDAKPLPAQVAGGIDDGIEWHLHVTTDTLRILPDGRWTQRARSFQGQSDGLQFNFSMNDFGRWTTQGSTVVFESEWIENVRFTGHLTANGWLVLDQNLLIDDEIGTLRLELKR